MDGYDLQEAASSGGMLERLREAVSPERWAYLNDVIVTTGVIQPRLKPGVAIAVLRDCLAAALQLTGRGSSTATSSPRTSW